ncbi:pyridoxal phosphate-dependent aminotransferase [Oceanobacillus caeni]|uniref:MalY/PatB family protein n=1 Tax=Oceanobacillus TaxID=182709 RepID=UPI00062207E1|nr:MalY/PatB family protein [Oceanobacillus caeni]KKE79527.1 cystathionine beta-lyase [Bacilli bacterium VT-13-104]PZD89764.1 pyridoxal phosphate-dependent aminotransferase [Bacilli bacterium]MBU8791829.1 pyridoxal phosphate-dependent aminotransferase [Oceanobacillus caeni]MCR1833515.1 pyridoxal phosphate-dependent aminotransferase [Oceanobacillus caeni]MED4474335.1 pyridoxal phosphate-dependent aminotransferase [Oceanobacillus caeni]
MSIFDRVHNRLNTRSMKWDLREFIFQNEDILPMWVADMDFQAPREVNEALIKRAEHGIYGYTVVDNAVKDSIVNWVKTRHDWEINREWLSFSKGVVTSLHMAIRAFTEPQDKILIQTPVYTPFYNVIQAHDREIVKNPLIEENNYYTINFNDFEEKLKSGVKAFILCSPHNPVGRVWKKAELEEMARLCLKYNVLIISDEIHADLVFSGKKHIPIASLSEEIANHTITCMAPSKTFNLAGLEASYVITTNKEKRKKLIEEFQKQGHGNGLNTMANTALEAAYNYGSPWLNELLTVLEGHRDYVTKELEHNTDLRVTPSEGTYLLWIDCSSLGLDAKELKEFMIHKARVGLNAGVDYGEEGKQYMRMNLACPRATIAEGTKRIIEAIKNR